MRTEQITSKTEVIEFDSLKEFYDYCVNTPFNEAFCWAEHCSVSGNKHFTQTENFQEAVELLKNGWSDMATKLVQKLKVIENQVQPSMKPKNIMSMAGYQAIVPVYLNNQPNAMLAKKNVPVKQKVITVNKSIDYNSSVKADTIVEESIKAMQVVKKLEAQGLRVNLNIVLGSAAGHPEKQFILKIRIKSANERLNVSKLAFPLVHPSMLRRLFFRFVEVYPKFTSAFVGGYGRPATSSELRDMFKGEYLLPNFIKKDVNAIKTIDDLENI